MNTIEIDDAVGRHPATSTAVLPPARLSVRIRCLLEERGGSIEQQHAAGYLATVLQVPEWAVRDVLLDEEAAGRLDITWGAPGAHEFHQRVALTERP